MTDYEQGQRDLILHIKDKVFEIVENKVKGDDIMLDVVWILQSLTPLKQKSK